MLGLLCLFGPLFGRLLLFGLGGLGRGLWFLLYLILGLFGGFLGFVVWDFRLLGDVCDELPRIQDGFFHLMVKEDRETGS